MGDGAVKGEGGAGRLPLEKVRRIRGLFGQPLAAEQAGHLQARCEVSRHRVAASWLWPRSFQQRDRSAKRAEVGRISTGAECVHITEACGGARHF